MLRIALFDDNDSLRQSIRLLLENDPELNVIGDFPDPSNAKEIVLRLKPDIVIMDIDMPHTNGIDAVRNIKEVSPNTEIIMLTVFEDDERLFASICAGASGYLLKMNSLFRLQSAVKEVYQGGSPMSPEVARRVIQYFQQVPSQQYALTNREKEMLQWLVKGYSYKMIAAEFHLSYETVKTHLKNIYRKLQVNCGTEAVAKALKEKLL